MTNEAMNESCIYYPLQLIFNVRKCSPKQIRRLKQCTVVIRNIFIGFLQL